MATVPNFRVVDVFSGRRPPPRGVAWDQGKIAAAVPLPWSSAVRFKLGLLARRGVADGAYEDIVEKFAAVAAEVHVRGNLMNTAFAQASRPAAARGLADLAEVEDVLISVDGAVCTRCQHGHGREGIRDFFLRTQEFELLLVPLHDGELANQDIKIGAHCVATATAEADFSGEEKRGG